MMTRSLIAALVLFISGVSPALAAIDFKIEEPAPAAIKSGIGQIAGWAVGDRKIVSVEAFINDIPLGNLPYGGSRQDVAAAFPDLPGAGFSGWTMKWNYSLLEEGEHNLRILIKDEDGAESSAEVLFYVTRFHAEFIPDPSAVETTAATVHSSEDGRIVLQGARVEGEDVDIELAWDTASQQFLIQFIDYGTEKSPNQSPSANAGPDFSVNAGDIVAVTGSASDPDGSIVSWAWQQISGTAVSLQNAQSQQVQFTAPAGATTIPLRLTVTDDDGASASDDVVISVKEDSEPDTTTGFLHEAMLPIINEARAQTRMCGDTEYPAQPPLQWSASLAEVAKLHSMDMARQGYFSHTSLDGTSMGDRVFPHWSGTRVGENIAASSIDRANSYVVDLWLDSPGHCVLIMSSDFTHAGIGSGHDTENDYSFHHFWTLDFGG